MTREQITPKFYLDELSVSASHPELVEPVPSRLRPRAEQLLIEVAQPIRDVIRQPMIITSGYRSVALNNAVTGSRTSQHRKAEAFDFRCANIGLAWSAIRKAVRAGRLSNVGQLIYYPDRGFIHAALPSRRFPVPTLCLHWPARGYRYAVLGGSEPAWKDALGLYYVA